MLLVVASCKPGGEPTRARETAARPTETPERSTSSPPTGLAVDSTWQALLDFDADGRDLMVASFRPPEGQGPARHAFLGSRVCRTSDPVQDLIVLGDNAGLDDPATIRRKLRCGRLVASQLPSSARRIHAIQLDRGGPISPVIVIPTRMTSLEPLRAVMANSPLEPGEVSGDFRSETYEGIPILCRPIDPDPKPCSVRQEPSDTIIAITSGRLVVGSFPVVASLLEWSRRSSLFLHLDRVARGAEDLGPVELDFLEPGGAWVRGRMRWLPFTREGTFEPLAEAVRQQARAVGADRGLTAGALVIAPRCESRSAACPARDALRKALLDYHEHWKRSATQTMAEVYERYPDAASPCTRQEESDRIAALTKAFVVEEDGLLVLRYATGDAERACAASLRDEEAAAVRRLDEALSTSP